jgi:hypothetical protein
VKFKLVKIEQLSGNKATIYSAIVGNEEKTLFDKFIAENIDDFKDELLKIKRTIATIAHDLGARE